MEINTKDKINYYSVTVQNNNNLTDDNLPIEEASNTNDNVPDYSNADYLSNLYQNMDETFNFATGVFFNSISSASQAYNDITTHEVSDVNLIVNNKVQFADNLETIKNAMDSNEGSKTEETSVRLEYIGDMEYDHSLIKGIYEHAQSKLNN